MKLTALAFILLLTSSIYTVNGQDQPKQLDEATKLKIQKLRELEAKLDSLPASAKVKTKGDDSSITIEWKETVTETASNKDNRSMTQTRRLDINLSELEVPDEYIDEIIRENPLEGSKCGELDGVSIRQIALTRKYELTQPSYVYPGDGYTITVLRPFVS